MKILLTHNFYNTKNPSGENLVFNTESELLKRRGNNVQHFTRHSDEIIERGFLGTIQGALVTPWNFHMSKKIRYRIDDFNPDIVHVHNTFPLISPSIFHAIGNRAAKILTLHNYRLFCPAAIPMRNDRVCTQCLDKRSTIPAVIHGCYRGSRAATIPLALSVELHRALRTWTKQVDAFICLSDFQRNLMIDAGLPKEKIHVKPNYYPGNPNIVAWPDRKPYVVFAGRLSAEKGIINLVRAWQMWGPSAPELRIIGDGELRLKLEEMAQGLPIKFLGRLPPEDTQTEMAIAKLLVLPSEAFETFGLVVVEAFAHGTAAAVSNLGSLPSLVKDGINGIVFEKANPQSLLQVVRNAWGTPGLLEKLSQGARSEFENKYTAEKNYATLIEIYHKAIKASRNE